MNAFDWSKAAGVLSGFGGESITLHVPKTGLPFFDTLRLYGAIDLYIGLREDVTIHDAGDRWEVKSRARKRRLKGRVRSAAETLKETKLSKNDDKWLIALDAAIVEHDVYPTIPLRDLKTPLDNPDSVLKDGVRDQAASTYQGLETGYGKKAKIPWADAVLAYAGQKRTESVANIMFLPVFEGQIDLSKVISPLRAWLRTPNVLCAQALILLALKSSLFVEGYQDRLTAVVYNTNLDSRKYFNYSGLIEIGSTAIGKMNSPKLVGHTYRIFQSLVRVAWTRQGQKWQSTEMTPDALAMAHWLMQPVGKNLSSMITSQERLRRGIRRGDRYVQQRTLFDQPDPDYIKEVFKMSYGKWQGDHEAVRKLAKAVASAIYHARQKDVEDKGKAWYDEVTMLRSAPSPKSFIGRAMILIEQGHREHGQVGTVARGENWDPVGLFASIGENQNDFETFRDLFRMYLVQESKPYKAEGETAPEAEDVSDVDEEEPTEGGDTP
jgi:hypothetical protein